MPTAPGSRPPGSLPPATPTATAAVRATRLLPTLLLFVFLSGLAALVYQVLWLRLLSLVFGVTVWAASTVLASFMGGLALGSFGAARVADRVRAPLRWYGAVELAIGLSALATPVALGGVEKVYLLLAPAVGGQPALLTVLRVALSCAVLLVPSALMGATLPLAARAALSRGTGLGARVSLLYATNTAGAIAGVLLAGMYLVGGVGSSSAFILAASLNAVVGTAAIATSFRLPTAAPVDAPASGASAAPIGPGARRLLLGVFTLSGFASFALEIIWFRILVFYIMATTYAFTMMLAAVLAGIAVGSYAAAPLIRAGRASLGLLAAIELALGVATLLSLAVLTRSRDVALLVGLGADRASSGTLGLPDLAFLAATFGALLPAAFLFGMAFPIGLHLWMGPAGATRTGERLGVFYGANVMGAIAGSLAAGFVLLPFLGSQASLVVAAAVSAGSGLLLLAVLRSWRKAALLGLVGAAAFAISLAVLPDPFAGAMERRYAGEQLLWREEGVQSTVSVHLDNDGARVLYLDGLHQADDRPEQVALHRMIGHLPMALHPGPKRVLVVGLGGGVTAGAVARHPGATVDVVELSPGVVGAAAWFRSVNDGVLDRANVRMRIDDARNHLLLRPEPYDVITADIIQPHHAGAGNVYSAEYFRLVRNSLADDGIALQWLGPFPETRQKLIARTFQSVFPETTFWAEGSLMIGSKHPLQLDSAAFARRLTDGELRAALADVGIRDFAPLLALYWSGPDELRAYTGGGPILTDDRPMVEYFLSLPLREPPGDVSRVRGDPSRVVKR